MALGGATKKLQKVADMGDELYSRLNELREQVVETRETVQSTNERVAVLEERVDQQTALLEALAEREDIDVDEVLTAVAIDEAEHEETTPEETTPEETTPEETTPAEAASTGTDSDDSVREE